VLKPGSLPKWIAAAAVALLLSAIPFGIYLRNRWPYRGREVVPALAETFSSTLTVGSYKRFYFPNPGFTAHNIVLHLHGSTNIPPIATVETLTATGSYVDFIFHPHHLSSLDIAGLHVQIPASGTPENGTKYLSGSSSPSTIIVDHVTANQSLLDVSTAQDKPPLHFVIHELSLRNVSGSSPIAYEIAFSNPLPPGEITSQGHLGPLKRDDLGSMPLSGKATLADADLSVFHGIAGKLQTATTFHGLLSRLQIDGSTQVPDFHVGPGQPEQLAATYHALLDATQGSLVLSDVQATAGLTRINASGTIDRTQGSHLTLVVPKGRIQDLMRMFARDAAPLTGTATLHADAFVPPDHDHFLKSLQVKGGFALSNMLFTHPQTQQTLDGFSQRASGTAPKNKVPDADAAAPIVASELETQHISISDGVVHFADLLFSLPGAHADGVGTFNLLNKQVDAAGNLHMDTDLSDATTGIKSVLLKPIDPFFKHKHGTVAPVHLGGTYDHPTVGLSLPGDKNHPRLKPSDGLQKMVK
jgi:hypothetical protein